MRRDGVAARIDLVAAVGQRRRRCEQASCAGDRARATFVCRAVVGERAGPERRRRRARLADRQRGCAAGVVVVLQPGDRGRHRVRIGHVRAADRVGCQCHIAHAGDAHAGRVLCAVVDAAGVGERDRRRGLADVRRRSGHRVERVVACIHARQQRVGQGHGLAESSVRVRKCGGTAQEANAAEVADRGARQYRRHIRAVVRLAGGRERAGDMQRQDVGVVGRSRIDRVIVCIGTTYRDAANGDDLLIANILVVESRSCVGHHKCIAVDTVVREADRTCSVGSVGIAVVDLVVNRRLNGQSPRRDIQRAIGCDDVATVRIGERHREAVDAFIDRAVHGQCQRRVGQRRISSRRERGR